MPGADDQITTLASALADRGGLKLWSVLVTILGDYAQGSVRGVPGTGLSAIVDRIGLQPQAMRVALHRLKRDGWIENRKVARVAFYLLSPYGLEQTQAVRAKVFESPAAQTPEIRVLVSRSGGQDLTGGADNSGVLPISRSAALAFASDAKGATACLSAPLPDAFPAWVDQVIASHAGQTEFSQLLGLLDGLRPDQAATPLDRAALRTLVLHGWRRLILRAHPVALAVLADDAVARSCAIRVFGLLEELPPPDPASFAKTI